jgi:hypothetical protein
VEGQEEHDAAFPKVAFLLVVPLSVLFLPHFSLLLILLCVDVVLVATETQFYGLPSLSLLGGSLSLRTSPSFVVGDCLFFPLGNTLGGRATVYAANAGRKDGPTFL